MDSGGLRFSLRSAATLVASWDDTLFVDVLADDVRAVMVVADTFRTVSARKGTCISTWWHGLDILAFLFSLYSPRRRELYLGTFGRFLNQFLFSCLHQVCVLFVVRRFGIEFSKAVQLSLFCLCVFPVFCCENGTHLPLFFFLSCNRLIFSPLYVLPLFFVSLNKAANGAWKWWQHSHAYRRTLSVVAICESESAHLQGWEKVILSPISFIYCIVRHCKGSMTNMFIQHYYKTARCWWGFNGITQHTGSVCLYSISFKQWFEDFTDLAKIRTCCCCCWLSWWWW